MSQLSYAAAGVSIDAGDELVERIKPAAKRTLIPGVLGSIGGFGALFEVSRDYRNPVLVTGTDGVGTKLMLAFQLGRHDTVGQDLVAMSVNDILVQGAKSLFFLDYYACGKLDVDAHGNEVLADRVVTAELEGEHELGAHAVRAGDENRVLVFLADFEERAEAADGAEDARDHRALGKGLDAFNEFVAGIDGNAGSRVGKLAHGKYLE